MSDWFGRALSRFAQALQVCEVALTSVALRLAARSKGVELEAGVLFVKAARFSRAPGSVLRIQRECRFRSDGRSNRVGVNRACYLSTLRAGAVLSVGPRCAFSGTVIAAAERIELGRYVRCGANTTIMDSDFHEDDPRSGEPRPVVIEDHVWLGLNVMVLKGVRIGRNSVVAAGSVVTKDIPANVVAGGVPAKVIKAFSEEMVEATEAFFRGKERQ
jgi:acetyltransferase-like isoleucine patch superfamily enzyme